MRIRIQEARAFASRHLGEVARFVSVGILASLVHLSILFVLTEYTLLWYLPATVIGFGIAFSVSFTLQKYWTFRERTHARVYGQAARFLLLQAGALTVNTVGLYVLVEFLGLWYLAGQALLLGIVAVGTYALSKFVIFSARDGALTPVHRM